MTPFRFIDRRRFFAGSLALGAAARTRRLLKGVRA